MAGGAKPAGGKDVEELRGQQCYDYGREGNGAAGVEEDGELRKAWCFPFTHHGFHERDGARKAQRKVFSNPLQ